MYDVIIVGGGMAGLSAALVLGRSGRLTLICDSEQPRNGHARAVHGFLTRDGASPHEMRRLAREQLAAYGTVQVWKGEVVDAEKHEDGFTVVLADGTHLGCRRLLLSTGLVDVLPPVDGAAELFGRGVFHCPYCDGWEVRGRPLAAYGSGEKSLKLALELTAWSDDVVLCSDGPTGLSDEDRQRLDRLDIAVEERRLQHLEGAGGLLKRICFTDGGSLARRALFFPPAWRLRSDLAARLGVPPDHRGLTPTDAEGATRLPGLYAAGDAAGHLHLVVAAAAEGAKAAVSINADLLKEDLAQREAARAAHAF